MIIDSHCHLTYEPMSSSLSETIERANNPRINPVKPLKKSLKYLNTLSIIK